MSKTLKIQGNKMFVDGNCVKEYSKKLSTKTLEEILKEATEKITDYGFNSEYGYYNDWYDGVEPIVRYYITQSFQAGRDSMREEIRKQQEKNSNKKLGKMSKEEQDYYNNL